MTTDKNKHNTIITTMTKQQIQQLQQKTTIFQTLAYYCLDLAHLALPLQISPQPFSPRFPTSPWLPLLPNKDFVWLTSAQSWDCLLLAWLHNRFYSNFRFGWALLWIGLDQCVTNPIPLKSSLLGLDPIDFSSGSTWLDLISALICLVWHNYGSPWVHLTFQLQFGLDSLGLDSLCLVSEMFF